MMIGNKRVCRTCLRADNLAPIFPRTALHEQYTLALFLTTGLQIEMDDGLPQTICTDCITHINTAIKFRKHSHMSERQLLRWGQRRKVEPSCHTINRSSTENINIKQEKIEQDHEAKTESLTPNFVELTVEFEEKVKEEVKLAEEDWSSENMDSPDEELASSVTVPKLSKKSMYIKIDERYQNLTDRPIKGAGPYKCKACKKILKNWATFRTHSKLHLDFELICEYCGKKFKMKTSLQLHLMTHHGAERTYRCQLCDHRAVDREHLQVHVRREHTGDRPYVCDTCGASFLQRRGLRYHLAVHITTKTVKCALCPAKFKTGQQCHVHTSKVHRRSGWRVQCYLCDKTYGKPEPLRKHLVKVHGVPRQQQAVFGRMRPTLATSA